MYVTANFITKAVQMTYYKPHDMIHSDISLITPYWLFWIVVFFSALKHQFITFAMKGLGSLTYIKLNSILQKYPKPVGQSFPYIVKMTGEQARVYMKEVLEGEGENGGQVDSSTPQPHLQLQPPSPTSVKILFTGPVVK